MDSNALLICLGLGVGAVQGFTGAGGGILALPLLLLTTSMTAQTAAPVAMIAVAVSAGATAIAGLFNKTVRYRAALFIAFFGWLVSPFGVWIAQRTPSDVLACLFATIMLRNGWVVWQRAHAAPLSGEAGIAHPECPCVLDPATGRFAWTRSCAKALARIGLLTGFLSGLLGVGGGFVIVPALGKYTNLTTQSIVDTSLMVIALVALAAVASAASAWGGGIALSVAIPFVGGAVAGSLSARFPAQKLSPNVASRGFALLSAAIAVILLAKIAFKQSI